MAYTLTIEDILPYAVCSRRYLNEQSRLYIESNKQRGLPCEVSAVMGGKICLIDGERIKVGGRNVYAYDPKEFGKWLRKRKEKYKSEQKNFREAEKLVDIFAREMEDISDGR